jgi:hypothetical protein
MAGKAHYNSTKPGGYLWLTPEQADYRLHDYLGLNDYPGLAPCSRHLGFHGSACITYGSTLNTVLSRTA